MGCSGWGWVLKAPAMGNGINGFSSSSRVVTDHAFAVAAGLLLILVIVLLHRGDTPARAPHALAETPAGISLECLVCKSTSQDVAKTAEARCCMFGKSAYRAHFNAEASGNIRLAIKCV